MVLSAYLSKNYTWNPINWLIFESENLGCVCLLLKNWVWWI